jgi:hypothetical protein
MNVLPLNETEASCTTMLPADTAGILKDSNAFKTKAPNTMAIAPPIA